MEKTTKKKKSKRARRRIGLIAVGGLSLVLTVCLSVGATLAWFAGSTWASNDLYMGGPVYVEMAGRGKAEGTVGTGSGSEKTANWIGGEGKLDIVASARTTGTAKGDNGWNDYSNILLPGQKLLIYSQARVFSTLKYDDRDNNNYWNASSGANTTNSSGNANTYTDGTGRVRSATTSVLRAKFSINVTFDPSVGFNNFTDTAYANAYPVQSAAYTGDGNAADKTWYGALTDVKFATTHTTTRAAYNTATNTQITETSDIKLVESEAGKGDWHINLDADTNGEITYAEATATHAATLGIAENGKIAYEIRETGHTTGYTGRRDAVNPAKASNSANVYFVGGTHTPATEAGKDHNVLTVTEENLKAIKAGDKVSIYKWQFVSENVYLNTDVNFRMGAPFDGTVNSAGGASNRKWTNVDKTEYTNNPAGTGNGFYGIWVGTVNESAKYKPTPEGTEITVKEYIYQESDAFYKARTEAYLQSYVEHYKDPYNQDLVLQIGTQIHDLEDALNKAFKGLVTESSDRILAGYTGGFTADDDGAVAYGGTAASSLYDANNEFKSDLATTLENSPTKATWLYVDPTIDNDINATDATTGTGGWWYLVESDTNSVAGGKNAITTEIDQVLHGAADTIKVPTGEGDNEITAVDGADVTYIANETDVKKGRAQYVGQVIYKWGNMNSASKNKPVTTEGALKRSDNPTAYTAPTLDAQGKVTEAGTVGNQNRRILQAKLFEVKPQLAKEVMGANATKVVSVSFPFVNGNFELPGKEMTNIFANARITFKISFQALQAFFPYSPSIDGLPAGSALAGTAKALNIENSIPVFNEAFNYLSYISK